MFQEESKNIQEIDPKLVMEREVQIRGSKNRSQKVSGHNVSSQTYCRFSSKSDKMENDKKNK